MSDRVKITYKKVSDLIPYAKNPRKNDEAVHDVAESIRAFGFKVPCVIDKNGVVVTGHTRIKACKLLGIEEVPCIVADDLSPEEIKAFRLADNKVSEKAEWDISLLEEELADISAFDMSDFGFDIAEISDYFDENGEQSIEHENARLKTDYAYNLQYNDLDRVEGFYEMPIIKPVNHKPKDLMGFNYVRSQPDYSKGVHFWIDDYQFERVWNSPEEMIERLKPFDCVITPDFSLYYDMPVAMQIWNVYRARLIGQMMQDAGITVIPNVRWTQKYSWDYCFEGLPKKSTFAVSSVSLNNDDFMPIFLEGMDEFIKRCQPRRILWYGKMVDYDFGHIEVVPYKNAVTERMKAMREKGKEDAKDN